MNVNEFNLKTAQALNKMRSEYPAIGAKLTLSALNLIKDRITNEGVDSNGKSFGKYSTNKLPFFFFSNTLGKKADKRFDSKQKKTNGISYEEWRKLNGLQTNHIDMQFTKETIKDITVLETKVQGGIITTIAASKNSITKKRNSKKKPTVTTGEVTEFLAERYGDFLTLSKTEKEVIDEAFDKEIQNLINKIYND